MFQTKRKLKKEKSKSRFKFIILLLAVFFFAFLFAEYFVINNNSKKTIVSPLAKNSNSLSLSLEKNLEKNKISYTSFSQSADGSLTINLLEGGVVILSSKKDISTQLSSLQLILSRLTIEGKKLKNLDLRFDSPVISF